MIGFRATILNILPQNFQRWPRQNPAAVDETNEDGHEGDEQENAEYGQNLRIEICFKAEFGQGPTSGDCD